MLSKWIDEVRRLIYTIISLCVFMVTEIDWYRYKLREREDV